jgi:hypothetical protein
MRLLNDKHDDFNFLKVYFSFFVLFHGSPVSAINKTNHRK